jgi:glycosyltransferase involved in cell wall biosynthesis
VLSVSAALPKKDWEVLVEAAAQLPIPSLDVIVAQTNAFEWVPDHIRTLAQEHGVDLDLRLDVPYDDAQRAIHHAGALVYAVGLDVLLGQPRSIIEAGLAATPLVVPQHPAMESMLGTSCHTYRRGEHASLSSALESALSDPHPMPERLDLVERLAATHSSPEVFAAWATSLTEAVVDWRRTHRKMGGKRVMTWWSSELTNRLHPS